MGEKIYDTFEDELDAIRLRLYEEIKHMTTEEKLAHLEAKTEPVMKEFNIKTSALKPVKPKRRALVLSE